MSDEDRAQDIEMIQREMDLKAQMSKNPPKPIKINCTHCEPDPKKSGENCSFYRACVDDVVRVREANKRNGMTPRW